MVNIKDKILQAALEEFLSYGKSGAKTKAISENAGVNKAMIHYYFSNKDQLFLDCVKYILKMMEGTFHTKEIRSIKDYKLYLFEVINSYTNFIKTHNRHITFLLWEYLNDKELLASIKEVIGSAHLVDFIEKTNNAIKDGVIRNIDPLDLYLNLISLILSSYMLLPITLSFLGEESEDKKVQIMNKREKEISRLLWEDIKGE